jgi:hypothetical protein
LFRWWNALTADEHAEPALNYQNDLTPNPPEGADVVVSDDRIRIRWLRFSAVPNTRRYECC